MDAVKICIENILYPLMEKRKGNKVRIKTEELICSEKSSIDEIKEIQRRKLTKLLMESIRNVPAYKEYRYLEDEIKADALSAFTKFPILRKMDFRQNTENYLNQQVSRSSLIPNRTGGSTGDAVVFYMDRQCVEYYEAARWRGLSWWGISYGSRSVMIWRNPLELNEIEQRKYRLKEKWLKNRIVIPAYSLGKKVMPEYIKTIIDFQPEYFYGYASALYAFSLLMLELGLELTFKPKAVVSTAEILYDYQRDIIESAFDCPVVNEYGARDGGILAYQCELGKMHISAENAILEVVDTENNRSLPIGESGLLLVTDLNNLSMPRLRYQIGDCAVLSDQRCECGRGLPLLEKIDGREDDMFVTRKGEMVHGRTFNQIARSLNSIERFQIIQESPEKACLKIIVNKGYDECDKEILQFISGVRKRMTGTDINVMYVKDIPTTASGKFRYAIRKFEI